MSSILNQSKFQTAGNNFIQLDELISKSFGYILALLYQRVKKQTKKYSLRKLFRSKSSKSNDGSPADAPTQGLARSTSRSNSSGDADAAGLGDPGTMIATVPTADLDLVQYIVGHGILRRDLRSVVVIIYTFICMYVCLCVCMYTYYTYLHMVGDN